MRLNPALIILLVIGSLNKNLIKSLRVGIKIYNQWIIKIDLFKNVNLYNQIPQENRDSEIPIIS